ncbi:hypothetical protein M0R45_029664 [Rubus argutus]|uniref:Cytochrome P450 n=1 Tax=Rubus argutus TaxID=59490 RepID=A0AAW1W8D4_RUBAR
MEYWQWYSWNNSLLYFVVFFAPALFLLLIFHRRSNSGRQSHGLPPGPPGWPIFGNMFEVGTMPHRTLTQLRHKYGPVMWLRLGAKNTMVIQSTKAATEFFKQHDLSFADRTVYEVSRVHGYHKGSLALAPYGSHWRVMRRLLTVDMLVSNRINDTASIRRKCADDLKSWIEEEASSSSRGVHVARLVFLMTFNVFGNLVLSRDLVGPRSEEGMEFFTAVNGLVEWSGHANMADYFPWLRWLDPQGLKRKMKRDLGKALEIASKFVKERINERQLEGADHQKIGRDFLDVVLELMDGNGNDEPPEISDHDLNIFILEIFMAGSETTSSTIEWALTELLCNPEALMKAKSELNQVIGRNRKIEESDIDNLPYLQGVIKETLRLHPPLPFLVPRKAMHDTVFMGYSIPKNTQVFVNVYAIGRDPEVWSDPLPFKPERFIGSKIDYKGQHYELIPFGAGRRMCAGVPLGHRMLHLTLGLLLHQFDWELDGNVTRETMDWNERLGMTMRKHEPLLPVPTKC